MEFEFDPDKSATNTAKHGIDFVSAQALWSDPKRVIAAAKTTDEPRFAIIAEIDGRLWTGIFTVRETRIRMISVRRARNEEKEIYHQRTGI